MKSTQNLMDEIESLRKKIIMKTEALLSVSKELAAIQNEMNQWKTMAETLERTSTQVEGDLDATRKDLESTKKEYSNVKSVLIKENERFKRNAKEFCNENNLLKAELKDLRSDCKVLRQKIARQEVDALYKNDNEKLNNVDGENSESKKHVEVRKVTLENLEKLNTQIAQLQRDMQALLCEKEELICDRDSLNHKVDRLSHELKLILDGDPERIIDDIDGIIAENRYLKAQLKNAQEETGLTRASLKKYRKIMNNKFKSRATSNGSFSDGQTIINSYIAEQVGKALGSKCIDLTDCSYNSVIDLLLDNCNDKQIALSHQRNANKILGRRIAELEEKLVQINSNERSPNRLLPKRMSFCSTDAEVQCQLDEFNKL